MYNIIQYINAHSINKQTGEIPVSYRTYSNVRYYIVKQTFEITTFAKPDISFNLLIQIKGKNH